MKYISIMAEWSVESIILSTCTVESHHTNIFQTDPLEALDVIRRYQREPLSGKHTLYNCIARTNDARFLRKYHFLKYTAQQVIINWIEMKTTWELSHISKYDQLKMLNSFCCAEEHFGKPIGDAFEIEYTHRPTRSSVLGYENFYRINIWKILYNIHEWDYVEEYFILDDDTYTSKRFDQLIITAYVPSLYCLTNKLCKSIWSKDELKGTIPKSIIDSM
jgi:hypothetical protein